MSKFIAHDSQSENPWKYSDVGLDLQFSKKVLKIYWKSKKLKNSFQKTERIELTRNISENFFFSFWKIKEFRKIKKQN